MTPADGIRERASALAKETRDLLMRDGAPDLATKMDVFTIRSEERNRPDRSGIFFADRVPRRYSLEIDLPTRETPLAQSTVSEHLRVLKDAGLIQQCGPGPRSGYCLNREMLVWLKQSVVGL